MKSLTETPASQGRRDGGDLSGHLKTWAVVCLVLGLGLLAGGLNLAGENLPTYERPVVTIVTGEALVLIALALAAALLGFVRLKRFRSLVHLPTEPDAFTKRPYWTLGIVSFAALFLELVLIRYSNSQVRIFSFYKNVPLIACFLGLGMGCSLGRGRPRHALLFLLWLVPVASFLSAGSLVASNALGKHAAIGSTEQILGDFLPKAVESSERLSSQVVIAVFCVLTLVVITLLFGLLGRLMGQAFESVERLPGYTVNIVGSLGGILAFVAVSYLELPPFVWFAVGLTPLLWWLSSRKWLPVSVGLIVVSVAMVFPSYGNTVWSRYQKLVGHRVPPPGGTLEVSHAYRVEISDVFYQTAVDRRPETLARTSINPYPHYDTVYSRLKNVKRVLIVGAGTGNDVAAALRAGVSHVDAVDIDPAILEMGRENHPERPYDDPRVRIVVDDARHAFRVMQPDSYDAVIFGLLDSHTQLGMSSVRLDNYVFTLESLAAAKRLVRQGGHVVITATTVLPWFYKRLGTMLETTVRGPVWVSQSGTWWTFIGRVDDAAAGPAADASAAGALPTDDWPFLYLPSKEIPPAYLWVVAALVLASVAVLRISGLPFGSFHSYHGHLFFLGAAFLLMEVHAINRLALLFGTTWLVSAMTIALVLFLIVCANFTVLGLKRVPYGLSYAALALSLGVSFLVQPSMILGQGTSVALAFGLLLLSPVFFAGLVFARSFKAAKLAAPAMGANILGSVVGGWIEYSTMWLGMRTLVLLAAVFYLMSFAMLLVANRRLGTE